MSGMSGDIQTQQTALGSPTGGIGLSKTDLSGTPGNGTANTPLCRCAIAALAASVTITCNICSGNSRVYAVINQAAADATLTSIVRIQTQNGSYTIFGNAAATGNVVVDCLVLP
jgi:hypothetical protein